MSTKTKPNFLKPRWRKVLSDLRDNRMRTFLVVASIAVGVFAVGTIVSAYVIIEEDIDIIYSSANPPNIQISRSQHPPRCFIFNVPFHPYPTTRNPQLTTSFPAS